MIGERKSEIVSDEQPPVDKYGRVWLKCPKCRKRNLEYDGHSTLGAFGSCRCGYSGLEVTERKEEK